MTARLVQYSAFGLVHDSILRMLAAKVLCGAPSDEMTKTNRFTWIPNVCVASFTRGAYFAFFSSYLDSIVSSGIPLGL